MKGGHLVHISGPFLAIAFSREGLFGALFLAWLEVKGVLFDLLNNVLLLDFPLEPAQGALERFALLYVNFSQLSLHPLTVEASLDRQALSMIAAPYRPSQT